jgi:hypothetical protein
VKHTNAGVITSENPWWVCNFDYIKVTWRHAHRQEPVASGAQVTIQAGDDKLFHDYWPDRGIINATEWHEPADRGEDYPLTGVMFTCEFPTGRGREFTIFADLSKS